jgi:hypothetical protein
LTNHQGATIQVTETSFIEVLQAIYNCVRLVRGGTDTVDSVIGRGDTCEPPIVCDETDSGDTGTPTEGGPDFSPGVEYLATIGITVTAENAGNASLAF